MAGNTRPPLILSLLAALIVQSPAQAATPSTTPGTDPVPTIEVTGTAEVTAQAARGAFSIGIEVTRPTAAAASAEAARIAQAVNAALKHAGLATADLKSMRLTVSPQFNYDDKAHQQHLDGFRAENSLQVNTSALDQCGSYIDAALGAGATSVSDIQYSPADEAGLRREALGDAVHEAQANAAALAAAAGGALGPLLNISTEQRASVMPADRMFKTSVAAPAAQTQLVPSDITVTASVTASWRYQPGLHGTP